MTLKHKLLSGLALNCLLGVSGSLCIMIQVQHMRTVEKQINQVRIPSALAAVRLSRFISDASFALRNYLLYGADPALATKYERARQAGWENVFKQYAILKQLAPPEDQELLLQLDSDLRNGSLKIQQDALADMNGHGEEGKVNALERMKGGAAKAAKVQADAVQITSGVERRLADDNAELAAAQTTSWITALVAGLLTSLCPVIGGLFLGRQVLGGIAKISHRIEEVAQGNLAGEPLTHRADDEIGSVVRDINTMQDNLRSMIHSVLATATQVAGAAAELSASSEQLKQNTEEQKSQSEQIVVSMQEMSATIAEISSNAASAAGSSHSAREKADEGGKIVGEAVTAMQALTLASRHTSTSIEELSKSSDQIGKVVSVIAEIAEQTNLLALNAAIEAARAGEQGRGFAVVAGEVRRLAERTGKATHEIGEMITNVQNEAKTAVDSIHSEIASGDATAVSAARAGESIEEILAASEKVNGMVNQIAAASHQQSAATDEVNRNLSEIARVIQMSSAGTEDTAKASAELSRLASELQGLVSRFHLSAAAPSAARRNLVK
jgi:methyl-accepting chemotaxis protein